MFYTFLINAKQYIIIYLYIHISAYTKLMNIFKEKYIQNILKIFIKFLRLLPNTKNIIMTILSHIL